MAVTIGLLIIALLLIAAILSSKLSSRFGVPALVLFVGVGMLAGSDGLIGIEFDNYNVAQAIGVFALNFILFFGGMETKTRDILPALRIGTMLSVFGTLITALIVGGALYLLAMDRISPLEAMLLGAIVSSTDAAAIFSIFRSKGVTLKHRLRPILELESGSNDPMAYFLTVTIVSLIQSEGSSLLSMIPLFLKSMAIGAVIGYIMGRLIVLFINRVNLSIDGLYPILVIALTLLTYATTELIGGNGILSIYIAGIIVGNHDFIRKATITKFYSGFSWLMQIIVFIMLGLLAFPSRIPDIALTGMLVALILIFLARPIAIFITTIGTKLTLRDKIMLSWGGLRGASPIIFATYPLVAGIESAWVIFHIVFFVSLTSVLLQGSTLTWVARKLSLLAKCRETHEVAIELSNGSNTVAEEIEVTSGSHLIGMNLSKLDSNAKVVLIERGGRTIIPDGTTTIYSHDILVVLSSDKASLNRFKNFANAKKTVANS